MADRTNYGKLVDIVAPPDLIEIQTNSYKSFLQMKTPPSKRKHVGMQAVFREVFPIESYDGQYALDFAKYEIAEPKMSAIECIREGQSYSAPLYLTFLLREGEETREEDVYMGELPLMTPQGSFVINGAERVIVSQLHRSPGICYEQSIHTNGSVLYSFRIIPDRGSWLEVQFDTAELLQVYLDRTRRRRKFLVSTFLRALGYGTDEELLGLFYTFDKLKLGRKLSARKYEHFVLKEDIIDVDAESIVARKFEFLTDDLLVQIEAAGYTTIEVVDVSSDEGLILKSIQKDPTASYEEALNAVYHKLRPGDPPTISNAKQMLKRLFFEARRYDLGRGGRYKIQQKLGLDKTDDTRTLRKEDVVTAIRYLISLKQGEGSVDDIDHLGSRRIRTVGELLENQCRVGLARTERLVKERMTMFDPEHAQIVHIWTRVHDGCIYSPFFQ